MMIEICIFLISLFGAFSLVYFLNGPRIRNAAKTDQIHAKKCDEKKKNLPDSTSIYRFRFYFVMYSNARLGLKNKKENIYISLFH